MKDQHRQLVGPSLNVLLSISLALVPVWIYQRGHGVPGDDELFYESMFFLYIGAILLLSRRYSKLFFIFGLLDNFFKHTSVVGGKYRAAIYGGISWITAAYILYKWITNVPI